MSERTDLSHYIPRRLDDAPKFLFWELDIAGIGLMGVLAGIATGFPILGLGLGVATAFFYSKLKTGKHPGIATHLLYWFTGFPQPKELPSSHIRELNG
ncbi:type IV conjugative transfer system protein TraL [Mycetohabitans rhizoxinica]|uniref:Type IV conjugative transfer system protein TraL n=1 Tax=Mycetohabitans rhizoxinica TaxID=412963 RepID=A0ABZ2PZV4_9BURK